MPSTARFSPRRNVRPKSAGNIFLGLIFAGLFFYLKIGLLQWECFSDKRYDYFRSLIVYQGGHYAR